MKLTVKRVLETKVPPPARFGIPRITGRIQLTVKQNDLLRQTYSMPLSTPFDLPTIPGEMYKHQTEALEFLKSVNGKGMLALEMGLGKTRVALEYLKVTGIKEVLILCPLSVVSSWVNEIKLWSGGTATAKVGVGSTIDKISAISHKGIVVLNYEGAKQQKVMRAIKDWAPEAIILDESTRIKNRTTALARSVLWLIREVQPRCVIPMSGAPVTNSPLDLWSQLKTLSKSPLGFDSWWAMRSRYAIMGGYAGKEIVSYRDLDQLTKSLQPVVFRKVKAECLDLPPKVYQVREVTLNSEEKTLYSKIKKDCLAVLQDGRKITASNVLVQLLRLQQVTSGQYTKTSSKLLVVSDLLEEATPPVVVWSRFRADLVNVMKVTRRLKLRWGVLDGSTSPVARGQILKEFSNGGIDVLAANPSAGGLGIQLQKSCLQVYFANDFSLEHRIQSEDRLHRIGQDRTVIVIDLVASGTIDAVILKAVREKESLAKKVMSDPLTYFE